KMCREACQKIMWEGGAFLFREVAGGQLKVDQPRTLGPLFIGNLPPHSSPRKTVARLHVTRAARAKPRETQRNSATNRLARLQLGELRREDDRTKMRAIPARHVRSRSMDTK